MHVWMHIINRCEMHDSDFDVLITTTFRFRPCNVHHYRACLKNRLTRTVTHCHVQFVNQLHYAHCVSERIAVSTTPLFVFGDLNTHLDVVEDAAVLKLSDILSTHSTSHSRRTIAETLSTCS